MSWWVVGLLIGYVGLIVVTSALCRAGGRPRPLPPGVDPDPTDPENTYRG